MPAIVLAFGAGSEMIDVANTEFAGVITQDVEYVIGQVQFGV